MFTGQGADGTGGRLPIASSGDAEKRLREEEAGEVRHDVAHIDKRSKKMVSSVQLQLQAAGLGPSKPVSVASSVDDVAESFPLSDSKLNNSEESDSSISSGTAELYRPPPITNSVLRELESQNLEDSSWLPEARYTEITNHECSEKLEESKLLQVLGQQDTFTWRYKDDCIKSQYSEEDENGVYRFKSDEVDSDIKEKSVSELQDAVQFGEKEQCKIGIVSAVAAEIIPEIEVETKKAGADIIGGSGYIASSLSTSDKTSDEISNRMKDSAAVDSIPPLLEQSTEVFHQESEPFLVSRSVLRPEETSTVPPVSPRADSPQQNGVTQASSEASILDLQDVEYVDADAEDGDDEAEHEEEKIKAPEEFSEPVCLFIKFLSLIKCTLIIH